VISSVQFSLTKCERNGLNAGIREFDLKSPIAYFTLLPDELIETGLSNLAAAVRGGIRSTIACALMMASALRTDS
jgi:hypothetical protein